MAAGGKFGMVQGISMYTKGGLPLGAPFADRGGAVVALRAVDLPFLGEGLGRNSG